MAIKTYLQAINDAMRQEMERDENVFIIGEDVGKFGGCFGVTQGLFTVTLAFRYETTEARSLDEVWTNPFGFSVYEYGIASDRLEDHQ